MRFASILTLVLQCCAFGGDLRFADFASTGGLQLVQSAVRSGRVLRLTPAKQQRAGAAWYGEKQVVSTGFDSTFEFQLTSQGGLGPGADGFAFVLQNSGARAIAGRGNAGGFAVGDGWGRRDKPGIPRAIAIFFDTFHNNEGGDPSDNYIAACTNGTLAEMQWPPPRLGYTRSLPVNLKDGRIHRARIAYRPPVLQVFLDDGRRPVLEVAADIGIVTGADGRAWVGFTASTGGGYENHDILSWEFTGGPDVSSSMSVVSSEIVFLKTACLPEKNLCTPDRPTVEEKGPGRWRVVLPANVEWGASVPNPSGAALEVAGATGTVCWDLAGRGADGCSGPAGNGSAGEGLVAAEQRPGALVMKNEHGRTWFSVNGRAGRFVENQGYFEFEVRER